MYTKKYDRPLADAVFQRSRAAILELIDNGADINEKSRCSEPNRFLGHGTPLDIALSRGRIDLVEMLFSRGAQISPGSVFLVLDYMNSPAAGFIACLKFILNNGADPNGVQCPQMHWMGLTPAEYAMSLYLRRQASGLRLDVGGLIQAFEMIVERGGKFDTRNLKR